MKLIKYYLFPKSYCKQYGHARGYFQDEFGSEPCCGICGKWLNEFTETDPFRIKWEKELQEKTKINRGLIEGYYKF